MSYGVPPVGMKILILTTTCLACAFGIRVSIAKRASSSSRDVFVVSSSRACVSWAEDDLALPGSCRPQCNLYMIPMLRLRGGGGGGGGRGESEKVCMRLTGGGGMGKRKGNNRKQKRQRGTSTPFSCV
jgi:hypothetical protein